MKKQFYSLIISFLLSVPLMAQNLAPELSKIKETDLKKDLYDLASDAFRGRRAGTIDELRSAVWVAEKARQAGLKPAGEDGSYFQFYNLERSRIATSSSISINDESLKLWTDVWPISIMDYHKSGSVTWLNSMADTTKNLSGKIVAMNIQAPAVIPPKWVSLWGFRYTALAIREQSQVLMRHGAAAIIFVADDDVESLISFTGFHFAEGDYTIPGAPEAPTPKVPIILTSKGFDKNLANPDATVTIQLKSEHFEYPSVNVVAKADGTDPILKKEYVLFSGHHDHDGVGPAVNQDSIWNGADDNGSVTVAMLAIGRAWTAHPGKRSALFVWHGAEERGLLGSRWFVAHPTVDLKSIVAVLNGDMIGRNAPDSAALLGVLPPHRNSNDLVNMTLAANKDYSNFKLDFSWDTENHPEHWYFRSDQVPYAQAGIPAIFFSTLLHPDYHTPKDEANRIDYAKLTKMSKWIYETGWLVSQTQKKPALDIK